MPKNRSNKFFRWEEAQAFLGSEDGSILTSYSNEQLTISFEQDAQGNLTGFVWETEDESGTVELQAEVTTPKEDDYDA